jgi:hypothetical protein
VLAICCATQHEFDGKVPAGSTLARKDHRRPAGQEPGGDRVELADVPNVTRRCARCLASSATTRIRRGTGRMKTHWRATSPSRTTRSRCSGNNKGVHCRRKLRLARCVRAAPTARTAVTDRPLIATVVAGLVRGHRAFPFKSFGSSNITVRSARSTWRCARFPEVTPQLLPPAAWHPYCPRHQHRLEAGQPWASTFLLILLARQLAPSCAKLRRRARTTRTRRTTSARRMMATTPATQRSAEQASRVAANRSPHKTRSKLRSSDTAGMSATLELNRAARHLVAACVANSLFP